MVLNSDGDAPSPGRSSSVNGLRLNNAQASSALYSACTIGLLPGERDCCHLLLTINSLSFLAEHGVDHGVDIGDVDVEAIVQIGSYVIPSGLHIFAEHHADGSIDVRNVCITIVCDIFFIFFRMLLRDLL